MFGRVRALSLCGCLVAAASGVAGCGGSSSSGGTSSSDGASSAAGARASAAAYARTAPATIVQDAVTAMSAATSFQAKGQLDISGTSAAATIAVNGRDVFAAIQRGGDLIKLTVIDGTSYLYGNSSFWKNEAGASSDAQVARYAGKWFKTPARAGAKLTTGLGDISPRQIASCLSQNASDPTLRGTPTIDGGATVEIHLAGTRPGASPGDLYVAAAAPHYPVRFQQTGTGPAGGSGPCASGPTSSGDGHGRLDFSQWNAVSVTAPANAAPLP